MTDNKLITFGIMVAVLLVLITGCNSDYTGGSLMQEPAPYDQIASCLTEKGAVLHKTDWCPHCNKQKEIFGDSVNLLTMVDCDEDRTTCMEAGIQGYPTWIINGESYPGVHTPENLASIAGCDTQ